MEEENKAQETQAKGNNMMLYVGLAVVAVLVVGGFLYLSGRSNNATAPTTDSMTEETSEGAMNDTDTDMDSSAMEDEGQMMEGDVREVTVDGSEYSFDPSSLTVTEGEKIRLTFNNVGNLPHNFVIDELGITTQTVPGGGSDTVEFTASQSGTFDFYCSVGNHRALGMEGELDVQ
jgi:plastocyanin